MLHSAAVVMICCMIAQLTVTHSNLPSSLLSLQAIGIGTISRRWISTAALNEEYAERKRQQEEMLEDEQVIAAEI